MDQAAAAAADVSGERKVEWGGNVFALPDSMPLGAVIALEEEKLGRFLKAVFSDPDDYARVLEIGVDEAMAFIAKTLEVYGMGESLASAPSSETTGT